MFFAEVALSFKLTAIVNKLIVFTTKLSRVSYTVSHGATHKIALTLQRSVSALRIYESSTRDRWALVQKEF